jgi:hypothetical protein
MQHVMMLDTVRGTAHIIVIPMNYELLISCCSG